MKQKAILFLFSLSLLLSGCSVFQQSYVSVQPHKEQRQTLQTDVIMAANYLELLGALEDMIASGTEVAAIKVPEYPEGDLEYGMKQAVRHSMQNDPIGSYAVSDIVFELGSSSGVPAVSVSISYHHNRSEIQRIRKAPDIQAAERIVSEALKGYEPGIVILVDEYEIRDFSQFVQDYAEENPQTVMEIPQVSQSSYGTGRDRVLELIFTYQTSRDSLRRMQGQVHPVFEAASLYVSGEGEDYQKFSQLYGFLMERFDYKFETSITPAYSLLRHGVGDSRAFATVYAAMCRSAGLECIVVTGTRSGEPWTWNIVKDDGCYYHVDLLRSNLSGQFRELTDGEMRTYVWDYSDYPECIGREAEPETEAAVEPEK
jgi:hypothetical protein